jgi:hypothetical protein
VRVDDIDGARAALVAAGTRMRDVHFQITTR